MHLARICHTLTRLMLYDINKYYTTEKTGETVSLNEVLRYLLDLDQHNQQQAEKRDLG